MAVTSSQTITIDPLVLNSIFTRTVTTTTARPEPTTKGLEEVSISLILKILFYRFNEILSVSQLDFFTDMNLS